MSLLKRQLVVVPLSLLLGFLVAYYSFKGALRQTAFYAPVHVGGGYNALGRIQPLNATAAAALAASDAGDDKARKKDDEVVPDGMKVKDLAAAVENATLGFGKIFVINAPHDADRKDAMVLASAFSKLQFSWIGDSSQHETRAPRSLRARDQSGDQNKPQDQNQNQNQNQPPPPPPPPSPSPSAPLPPSLRAHLNALRTTIELSLSTSLILLDTLDWDLRLPSQLSTLALSTRTLTQPLARKSSSTTSSSLYFDPTFPSPSKSPNAKPASIAYADRPATIQPATSPYGDNWDVLWLGHTGMRVPGAGEKRVSRGRVVLGHDETVALGDKVVLPDGVAGNQTRVYHHVNQPGGALAYAVSQRGARRILYEISRGGGKGEGIEGVLGRLCAGMGVGGERKRRDVEGGLVCLTVQPSLFAGWMGEGGSEHVRWSVRGNMGRRVEGGKEEGEGEGGGEGEGKWVDQYPG